MQQKHFVGILMALDAQQLVDWHAVSTAVNNSMVPEECEEYWLYMIKPRYIYAPVIYMTNKQVLSFYSYSITCTAQKIHQLGG